MGSSYLVYLLAAGIIIIVVWISIKAAISEARRSGASEERIKEKESEADKKAKATDEILKEVDPGDTEKQLDQGTF